MSLMLHRAGLLRPSLAPPAPVAPDAFGAGDWSIASGDEKADITINALPPDGGSAISDIEFRLDGGSWVSSGGTSSFTISGLTNDQEYDVALRAVNSAGAGVASDTKQVTPTAEGGDALADLLSTLGCKVWHDGADATAHFVERSGSPPSTGSSLDGVVGSILNKGLGGGYFRTGSDSARGAYRSGGRVQIDGSNDIYTLANSDIGISPSTVCTIAIVFQIAGGDGEGNVIGTNGYGFGAWYNDGDSGTDISSWPGTKTYRLNGSLFTGSRGNLRTAGLAGPVLLVIEGAEFPSISTLSYGCAHPTDNSSWFIMGGYLHQFVIIPSAISSGDRATLESLLAARLPS